MKRILLTLATLALLGLAQTQTPVDPWLGENQETALVSLPNGDDMFYWLLRSRREPTTDPLVFWLTGGPGCSSEVALFFENGAFKINKDDLSLSKWAYSWKEVSNVVFIDNPVGTGFSDVTELDHLDRTEEEIAANLFLFL